MLALGGRSVGSVLIDNHRRNLRLGNHLAVDLRLAVEPPGAAPAANLAHMKMQLLPRYDRLPELGPVDAHEIDELRLVVVPEAVHAQGAGGLCDTLDDEHPRHHRKARKMALKERLVGRDALDADR